MGFFLLKEQNKGNKLRFIKNLILSFFWLKIFFLLKDLIKGNNLVLFNFFIGIGKKISYMYFFFKMIIKIINGVLFGENKL